MPAAAMPAVIAAAVLAGPAVQSTARADLPAKSPEQVMALMAGSKVQQLSGTVEESASLGLPQLPGPGRDTPGLAAPPSGATGTSGSPTTGAADPLAASTISQLLGFLAAPHTVRVYLDGPANQRVQFLDQLGERDIIRHGTTVWSYDSGANTATELTLPNPRLPQALKPGAFEQGSPARTPGALARALLQGLDQSTRLDTGANTTVAGRTAYTLELVPKSAGTLIGKVSIAVDAATGLPLRVTVSARGQDTAALEIGFSKVKLAAPPASTFLFTPPPGATVTKKAVPDRALHPTGAAPGTVAARPGAIATPLTAPGAAAADAAGGTGWATIAEAPAGTVALAGLPALSGLLQAVPGGHALSTTLFTVLVTPDGAVYAGAVPLAALQQVAAAK